MDGKPTYLSGDELMSLLKSTPATNADKIDLITQPSARHDAAGSSRLIDIRTRKIRLRGVNLALNGNGSLGRTGGGYGGVSMNVRENKFNLYLNYSYYQGKDVIDLFIDRAFERDGGRMMQNSYRKRRNYSHYFRTGCDYYLNERTVWGVSLGGNFSRQKEKMQACLRKSKKSELREILIAMRSKTGTIFLSGPVWCISLKEKGRTQRFF